MTGILGALYALLWLVALVAILFVLLWTMASNSRIAETARITIGAVGVLFIIVATLYLGWTGALWQ